MTPMRSHTRVATAVALALLTAACGTGTEPDVSPELDAEAALDDLEALESTLSSDDLSGFRALGGRTPFGSSPAAIDAVAGIEPSTVSGDGRAFALDLARRLSVARSTATDGPAAGPIISGWHRGTTFVYDPESDQYTPDLTREGAPETGVRFIIYEVDDGGVPMVDREVGYADLIDEGDGSVEDIVLRLIVVRQQETILDYRTTLDHDATSGALTVDGYLAPHGTRLDFHLGLAVSQVDGVGRLDLDFEFAVPARDLSVVGRVRGVEENEKGEGDVELEVRRGADRLGVEVTGRDGELEGAVFVDGQPFALISGPAEDPVITDPDGEPLTWAERLVLRRIVDMVEGVFDFLEDVVDPVDELVVLGIIL